MSGLTARWEGEFPRPGPAESSVEWAHHGIAALPDGRIVVADARGSRLAVCHPDGDIESVLTLPIIQAHGITVENGADGTFLWIADNGDHRWVTADGSLTPRSDIPHGRVLKVALDGEVLLSLGVPKLPQYRNIPFSPTHVVVDEVRAGGDVWVCDGYGASLVIRVTREGEIAQVIDGERGMGRFNQPHGATIDRRHGHAELLVADRANGRIQAFDLDGRFRRGIGVGVLRSPGHFAPYGSWLLVAELHRRIMALDVNDAVHTVLDCRTGADGEFEEGWPNALTAAGGIAAPAFQPGILNSPHSIAVTGDRLLVAEWVIGGRLCTYSLTITEVH